MKRNSKQTKSGFKTIKFIEQQEKIKYDRDNDIDFKDEEDEDMKQFDVESSDSESCSGEEDFNNSKQFQHKEPKYR